MEALPRCGAGRACAERGKRVLDHAQWPQGINHAGGAGRSLGSRGSSRDLVSGSKAALVLLRLSHRLVRSIDGCEASACDAKRNRSAFVIASPDRERATGPNLFQQAGTDQLSDDLSGCSALNSRQPSACSGDEDGEVRLHAG